MTPYAVYDRTGRIMKTGVAPDTRQAELQAGAEQSVVRAKLDPATQMIQDGVAVPRPVSRSPKEAIARPGTTLAVHVDPGAKVRMVPGRWTEVPDGQVLLELAQPGTYRVFVRPPWPLQEYTVSIHAYDHIAASGGTEGADHTTVVG